jgi:hypothetical protein
MDVATVVLTASSIIIILQVVSIILIVKSKKVPVEKTEAVPAQPAQTPYDQRDFRKRRDDNRFNRRPGFEQKQKPVAPAPPQAVDYVEKSLRDINLKLKNAERDQEDARKKIREEVQGPSQGGGQPSPRRFDNNQNRPNRGRGDDFRRRDGRDRDRNRGPYNNQSRDRDQNRDQNRDRPLEQERPLPEQARPAVTNEAFNPPPQVSSAPEQVMRPPQAPVVLQPVIEKEPLTAVPENTEIFHGRKVLVRRRILTPEEQAAKDRAEKGPETAAVGGIVPAAPVEAAPQIPASESKPAEAAVSQPPENVSDAEPIRFGR